MIKSDVYIGVVRLIGIFFVLYCFFFLKIVVKSLILIMFKKGCFFIVIFVFFNVILFRID